MRPTPPCFPFDQGPQGAAPHAEHPADTSACASGRSETQLEYDVAFDDEGRVSALAVRGWFLAGADQDLAFNDMMILQVGADQASRFYLRQ